MNIRRNIGLASVFFMLVLIQIVSPMVIGHDTSSDMDSTYLDDVAFYYYDGYGSSKLEHCKDHFQRDTSEIINLEEIIMPVKTSPTGISLRPMDSAWPMMCHDTHHTSQSSFSTINITDLEKWRFRCDGVESSPIIGDDGTIYFGDKDGYVYALYPNGTLKWSYRAVNWEWITSTPALAEDGTLYVGSWDHKLYAFNSTNGIIKWKFNAGGTIVGALAIADDGTIHFGTMWDSATGHRIWAVNPDGTEKWQYKTGNDINSAPAIGDDGIVYIGSHDDYLYAMNPNGTLKWRYKAGDKIYGSPSIADDGTIYIGSSWGSYLYALYPNGTLKWKYKNAGTPNNPSIGNDGTIYAGYMEKLVALYPNGTLKWEFDIGNDRFIGKSAPAISAEGTIYFGIHNGRPGYSDGGEIIAINSDGTEIWRKRICYEWCDSSPAIAEDGTVYIGTQCEGHGYLHAFGPVESNSPPETPTISGKINGSFGEWYEYTFRVVDPDNNPISWYIEWDDGTHTGWTTERASNEKCYYGHKWSEEGTYTIRAKAKDVLGEESDWAYLEVTMPKSKQSTTFPWIHWFLESHPRMFPIMRQLLGL